MGARMRFREAVESWTERDIAGVPEAEEASGDGREAAAAAAGEAAGTDGEAAAEEGGHEVQEQRRPSINTGAERVHEAAVQEENGPIVEVEEIDNERNLVFYAKTLSTGRVTHHFLDRFYRYDRNKVRLNGCAFFRCSVRGCTPR